MAFIKQEALEKAREIKVKADEEFAIEKAKLVKQEQQAIDAQYEKKRKGAEVAQKMCVPPLASYFPSPTMLIEYRYAVRNLL